MENEEKCVDNTIITPLGHVATFVATALAGVADMRICNIKSPVNGQVVTLSVMFLDRTDNSSLGSNVDITFSFITGEKMCVKTHIIHHVSDIHELHGEPAGKLMELHITRFNKTYKYEAIIEHYVDVINPYLLLNSNSSTMRYIIGYIIEELQPHINCQNIPAEFCCCCEEKK